MQWLKHYVTRILGIENSGNLRIGHHHVSILVKHCCPIDVQAVHVVMFRC